MKVLVIGKGGREHAIAHAVSRSSKVTAVYAAPGNPGMKSIATNVNISDSDVEGLVAFAKENQIDLTIVGPEHTLSLGVVDAFQKEGLKIFGPTKAAAQVESSKDFAKRIMMRHGIPTAAYATFDDKDAAVCYVKEKGAPIVVKEDGLKAGKGVTVAHTVEEALDALDIAFAQEGNKVVIEECLTGFEFSLICFVCGDVVVPMEIAQDHKCAFDGDTGPNTGGMGVYSPVRRITPQIIEETMNTIMKPMAKAMVEEGVPFTGFLYGGLMLTDDGVKTIEFNARFGDPEAEVILPRLKSDFVEIIETVMDHEECTPEWSDEVTLGVVLASAGYPASSTKGAVIEGLDQVDALVYHMGTAEAEGKLVTAGGRVLIIVAQAPTLEDAYAKAYAEVAKVRCDCLFHRNDIGKKDMH
ncbi:MAG TPA: phosphoribosylamine--glycine ligase [Candidatus Merdibacter merdavium]|uniref:Phosphoribosylamine--glycine ligase n=1 Tax=Candidatus Merdibacter merdavium TaxID=2838692 RepID=A0A9D2NSD9_9FIRM|nr:phosphoribosylamine--glycine ligase [Candidatus Merdibacter merdavium]